METRDLLHKNKLDEFRKWLFTDGWTEEKTKGEFEILRATKPNKKRPLIIYKRIDSKEHYSIDDRDIGLVIQFLNSSKRKKEK